MVCPEMFWNMLCWGTVAARQTDPGKRRAKRLAVAGEGKWGT